MQSLDFTRKTVLITGAGGGLGRALAGLFAARGAHVSGLDQSLAMMEGMALAGAHACDLTDSAAVAATAARLTQEGALPDILINNAGWTRAETMADLDATRIAHEITLNLTGTCSLTAPVAAAMAARGRGAIVFVASVNGLMHFGNPAYAAAKAGLIAFSRALAVEYGGRGLRSNAVCPGSIRTPAWDHRLARDPSIAEKLAGLYPMGRIVTAEEVAEAVAFLASDRASGITGTALAVDGGLTAGNKPFLDQILGASA